MTTGRGNNQHASDRPSNRTICVSVRLSPVEATRLDLLRGTMQRGSFLRSLFAGHAPVQIPQINLDLHRDLGRSLGNLATIAVAMRGGEYIEIDQIRTAVRDLRRSLIGAASEAPVSSDKTDF